MPRHLDPADPRSIALFGGGHVRPADTVRGLDGGSGWRRSPLGPPVLDLPRAATAGRSATATCPDAWPIETYQTVFSGEPGSAEMPSATRPFTTEVVDRSRAPGHHDRSAPAAHRRLVARGRRAALPRALPGAARDTRRSSTRRAPTAGAWSRSGTTVVRALATVTDDRGIVHPGAGWTDVVVTPETPTTAVDGLITGWHEPEATHLLMLEAIAGHDIVADRLRDRARRSATSGTSSATATCSSESGPAMSLDRTACPPDAARRASRRCSTPLRRRGEATAEQVAEQLGMTVSGARQHLTALVDDGLVEATELPTTDAPSGPAHARLLGDRQRPTTYFPKAYGELTNELLGYLDDTDPASARRLFAKRREHRISAARARLAAEAHARGTGRRAHRDPRRGRLPRHVRAGRGPASTASSSTTARSGRWRRRYGQACTSEIDFIRAVAPRRDGRAGPAHGRRRAPLRLRDPRRLTGRTPIEDRSKPRSRP